MFPDLVFSVIVFSDTVNLVTMFSSPLSIEEMLVSELVGSISYRLSKDVSSEPLEERDPVIRLLFTFVGMLKGWFFKRLNRVIALFFKTS